MREFDGWEAAGEFSESLSAPMAHRGGSGANRRGVSRSTRHDRSSHSWQPLHGGPFFLSLVAVIGLLRFRSGLLTMRREGACEPPVSTRPRRCPGRKRCIAAK
jgi:hypothetical protein